MHFMEPFHSLAFGGGGKGNHLFAVSLFSLKPATLKCLVPKQIVNAQQLPGILHIFAYLDVFSI